MIVSLIYVGFFLLPINIHVNPTDYTHHLQEFISNEGGGEPPLEGSMPDMISSTELVLLFFLSFQGRDKVRP